LRKTLTVAGTRSGWRVSGSGEGIAEILNSDRRESLANMPDKP
jgi:hypothetical protein